MVLKIFYFTGHTSQDVLEQWQYYQNYLQPTDNQEWTICQNNRLNKPIEFGNKNLFTSTFATIHLVYNQLLTMVLDTQDMDYPNPSQMNQQQQKNMKKLIVKLRHTSIKRFWKPKANYNCCHPNMQITSNKLNIHKVIDKTTSIYLQEYYLTNQNNGISILQLYLSFINLSSVMVKKLQVNKIKHYDYYIFQQQIEMQVLKNRTSQNKNLVKIEDRKGKQTKLQNEQEIHRENLFLLMKMHRLETKKKKTYDESFHIESLNMKKRLKVYNKIQNENVDIIKRLQSQKSRYSTDIYKEQFRKTSNMSRSIRRTKNSFFKKTQISLNKSKIENKDFEMLPTYFDGFKDRLIIYTEIFSVKEKSLHLEISKNNMFYYLLLQQFSTQRYFKLRLVLQTGDHLINLIKKGGLDFTSRIIKKGKQYVLTIPFFPFVRSFTFWQLKKSTDNNVYHDLIKKHKTQQNFDQERNEKSQTTEKQMFLKEFEESIHLREIHNNKISISEDKSDPQQINEKESKYSSMDYKSQEDEISQNVYSSDKQKTEHIQS